MTPPDDKSALIAELQAIPQGERMDYLAKLPRDRLAVFLRILPPDDRKKLNQHIDLLEKKRREPSLRSFESWMEDARNGRASTPEAMVEALKEVFDRIRPQDADWIRRIDETASASGFSKRQRQVIEGIYARYFLPR